MKITQKNIEDMENEAALKVAAEIKKTAAEEVEVSWFDTLHSCETQCIEN